jgi:hypothetical protein
MVGHPPPSNVREGQSKREKTWGTRPKECGPSPFDQGNTGGARAIGLNSGEAGLTALLLGTLRVAIQHRQECRCHTSNRRSPRFVPESVVLFCFLESLVR